MDLDPPFRLFPTATDLALQVYLLGSVDFEAALNLQRRLVDQVTGDRHHAALVVCEHPPLITIGRQGSRAHILCEPEELRSRRWQVRWVNRGGGCILHLPGQLAIYSILPLDRLSLGVQTYLDCLHRVVLSVLQDFDIRGAVQPGQASVRVGSRAIACTGVAVRDWVTYYGMVLNVNPDLGPFRLVRCGGHGNESMTSLGRERRGALRLSLVRERLVEHFAAQFHFHRTALFHDHPALKRKAPSDAIPASS